MSIKSRLITLVCILLLGLVIVGGIALNAVVSWSNDMHKVGDERVPGLLYLTTMNTERMIIRSQTLEVLTLEYDYNAQEKFSHIAQQRIKSWQLFEENWKKFEALPRASDRGRQAVINLGQEYKAWRDIYVTLDSLIDKLSKNKDIDIQKQLIADYKKAIEIMIPISNKMGNTMVEQMDTNIGNTQIMIENATNSADRAIILTIIIVLVSFIIGILFAITTFRIIINSLEKVKDGLINFFSFVNKELNHTSHIELDSNDEFGQMATMINHNIEKTTCSLQTDEEFVKDVARFVNELKSGNMLAKIDKNSNTQSLIELKEILTELQYYLEHTIARDLNRLISVLESYKKQDFRARFPEPYAKVAVIVNELGDVISNLLKQSLVIGKSLEDSSSKLIKNVNVLNNSSNEAAASLEETAAALEEITSTIVNNSNNIAQMSSYSNIVSISAKKRSRTCKKYYIGNGRNYNTSKCYK